VGVAFAFIGTLLIGAAAGQAHLPAADALLWTRLRDVAPTLNPALLKMAFIFLLIGYGTKAGLAPMHNWLPDAHSQAPAPVSAVFSGFLLNSALYCILRCLPLVEAATGNVGWASGLLTLVGLVSILVAAAFILFQRDAKRLLAYSSVEHMGIIALGVGLGGVGVFAAMFHVLNHSLCKPLAFFSAGRLGQRFGTHDLGALAGAARSAPLWGGGLFVSLLALVGVAPFAIFMSEFLMLKAAVDKGDFVVMTLFLTGISIVFVAALRYAIAAAWGKSAEQSAPASKPPAFEKSTLIEKALVWTPLGLLLVVGLWMPDFLRGAMTQAAGIITGGP
jgi:hydrogenase-4 component F